MNTQELAIKTKELIKHISDHPSNSDGNYAIGSEFLRQYGPPNNSFYASLKKLDPRSLSDTYISSIVRDTLAAFLTYIERGLNEEISPERKTQIDVVSDFLDQANTLLNTSGVHPAAPAMIIGATLEEFLRTWVEASQLSIGNSKPSIDSYAKALREAEMISKQDIKDVTSWAGIRNHAAHGEWDEVSDQKRISLMLEGVNLFMRQYTKPK